MLEFVDYREDFASGPGIGSGEAGFNPRGDAIFWMYRKVFG